MTWNPRYLLWTDIETSGLNVEDDNILEMSVGVAEFKNPFTLIQDKIFTKVFGYKNLIEIGAGNYDVIKMHTLNGLIDDCLKAAPVAFSIYFNDFRNFIQDLGITLEKDEKFVIAGASCSFDKAFIMSRYSIFPLHYRTYDVSSLRLFCHSVGMPEDFIPKIENKKHRAESDLRDSINLGKLCNEWLLTYIA